ncbi:tetratricopeptide repeat protein [Ottowia testudinis]|uniref:protein O-GlcNAc transferase n=1 Tax=Ottowia testudinis TaxID=2816950 RepID=A0A975CJC1_9BURK|nr:tetratricopeptide repeat protein [Ottowia testudinis]QTD46042.1 tetratricopeptide repeat protein [Ottowia testudinis]
MKNTRSRVPVPPLRPRPPAAGSLDVLYSQAVALHRAGRLADAKRIYETLLSRQPDHHGALYLMGTLALQGGGFADACRLLTRALALNPQHPASLANLAMAQSELGRYDDAIQNMERALQINGAIPNGSVNLAGILIQAGRHQDALNLLETLGSEQRNSTDFWTNLGLALDNQPGRKSEATAAFRQAVVLSPNSPKHKKNLAQHLQELGANEEAMALLDQLIVQSPDYAEAYLIKAKALQSLGQTHEAIALCMAASRLKITTPDVLASLSRALTLAGEYQHALRIAHQALELHPDHHPAHVAAGFVLRAMHSPDLALIHLNKALALKPGDDEVLFEKALCLNHLKNYSEAIETLNKIDPEKIDVARTILFNTKQHICDWEDFSKLESQVANDLMTRENIRACFVAITLFDDPAMGLLAAKKQIKDSTGGAHGRPPLAVPEKSEKIRIGYFSADFHEHATMYLISQVLSSHDQAHFDVHLFSYGPIESSPTIDRVKPKIKEFHYVKHLSDQAIADLSRSLRIDIAIDLKGHTTDSRMGIFPYRCAPIQVSYLGYPGTTASEFLDYVIADKIVLPPDQQKNFTEKVVYLPHCYQCNDSERAISSRSYSRHELGLPDEAFVFCCFNNTYKVIPSVFACWMRILSVTPGSVLWLYQSNEQAAENLRGHAAQHGIDPDRLVFAKHADIPEHLARIQAADLFLDTYPCNAHTTASDALWAGVPVLTRAGQSFASRVAASLLSTLELGELITHASGDYEALAIALAREPQRLRAIRDKLVRNRQTSPLFDGQRFARDLEKAYLAMMERAWAGLPPDLIEVSP